MQSVALPVVEDDEERGRAAGFPPYEQVSNIRRRSKPFGSMPHVWQGESVAFSLRLMSDGARTRMRSSAKLCLVRGLASPPASRSAKLRDNAAKGGLPAEQPRAIVVCRTRSQGDQCLSFGKQRRSPRRGQIVVRRLGSEASIVLASSKTGDFFVRRARLAGGCPRSNCRKKRRCPPLSQRDS